MLFTSCCAACQRPGPVICRSCRFWVARPPLMPETSEVIAAVPFVGPGRDLVLGLKYRNRRQLVHHLAGTLFQRLVGRGVGPHQVDVVTWAPTGRGRRRRRGFDQAELIARRVAAHLGVPCRRLLERSSSSGPQTGCDRSQRLVGPEFTAVRHLAGERVLLVDDVATTGSTLRSATSALLAAGSERVIKAAVAVTPALPVGRRGGATVTRLPSGRRAGRRVVA